jgi:fumarate hydratase class II
MGRAMTKKNKLQNEQSDQQGYASDSFGKIAIPKDALWGAQTQRSLEHFKIGWHRFQPCFIEALLQIKRAAAQVNREEELLDEQLYEAIMQACDEVLSGGYWHQFPLHVWQTGSGTQTNMNVNEVVSSLANTYLAKKSDKPIKVHPNDHVNMSQSSNDVFPTAMHIAVVQMGRKKLFPAFEFFDSELAKKQQLFKMDYSVGRTHLMDALPLSVGAVFSAYRAQLAAAKNAFYDSLSGVYQLAVGGTAVGSGRNAPPHFSQKVIRFLAEQYGVPFVPHPNLYAAVSGEDDLLRYSASLKQLAGALLKIANDFRLMGSGPRCGINEWRLPANEPGSSIMPGKVNPTQCEALSMVCLQVFGNDATVSMAVSQGQLQLNVYRPLIIHNVLESIELLSDAMLSFAKNCISGLTLNKAQIEKHMANNFSAITVLAPQIGYDAAARIVHEALRHNLSLGLGAEKLGLYSAVEFDAMLREQLEREDES